MNPLKLSPEECSPFGVLVLQYLENNPQTNMSQMAQAIDISRAGLGAICRKQSNPHETTATKIAEIIGADISEVARLVYENKIETLARRQQLSYATKFSKNSVIVPIPKEDAIASLNLIFQSFHVFINSVPEADKPTDFQIYKEAYEVIKHRFLSRKISRKQKAILST